MTFKIPLSLLSGVLLSALIVSAGGCGGGGAAPPAAPDPVAAQPLDVAPPVVTLNPPTLTQPTPAPAAPGTVAPDGVITSANSCSLARFQADLMSAINTARSQPRACGGETKPAVAALDWNDTLLTAAIAHSQDMAQRNYFSHVSPEGKTAGDRALLAGYRFTALGENIAAGQPSVSVVIQGWLASEGHCRNIMNTVFTQVAVACVTTTRQQYPTYWTMVLGKPQ